MSNCRGPTYDMVRMIIEIAELPARLGDANDPKNIPLFVLRAGMLAGYTHRARELLKAIKDDD